MLVPKFSGWPRISAKRISFWGSEGGDTGEDGVAGCSRAFAHVDVLAWGIAAYNKEVGAGKEAFMAHPDGDEDSVASFDFDFRAGLTTELDGGGTLEATKDFVGGAVVVVVSVDGGYPGSSEFPWEFGRIWFCQGMG